MDTLHTVPQMPIKQNKQLESNWFSLLDGIDDALVIIDKQLKITYINSAFLHLCGSNKIPEEVIGIHCYEFFQSKLEPCPPLFQPCQLFTSFDYSQPIHFNKTFLKNNNEAVSTSVTASPIRDSHGKIIELIFRLQDITKLKTLELQAEETSRRLFSLHDISDAMYQTLELDSTLNTVLDKALSIVEGDIGGILLLNQKSKELHYRVHRGFSEQFVNEVSGLKLGEGIAGKAAETRQPIWVDDLSTDSRVTRSAVSSEGIKAFASIPLIARGKLLGVMNLTRRNQKGFNEADINLISNISQQLAIAIENAMLYKELQEKEENRGELLRQLIAAQEEERKRIARGLHDEISQSVTVLAFHLEAILESLPPRASKIRRKLTELQEIPSKMQDDLHRVINELRPSILDDFGLVSALQWLSDKYLTDAGITVKFKTKGEKRAISSITEITLFRIAQEASTNILRHSNASNVIINLNFKKTATSIHIEDDGKGFNPQDIIISRDSERGLGLLGMRERAKLIGGTVTIDSQENVGTTIDCEIPT